MSQALSHLKLAPEPLDIDGTILSYNWVSHTMPAFEGIFIDTFIVRLDKVRSGDQSSRYNRVDFWGVHDNKDYQLPDAVYEAGHRWSMHLVPRSEFHDSTCAPDVQRTIKIVDESSGKVSSEAPAFRELEAAPDMPDIDSLPCYVLKKHGIKPAGAPSDSKK